MIWLGIVLNLLAVVVWLFGAEWTVNAIESDPLLWDRWYALPRALRAFLVVIAWPLLTVVSLLILLRANSHE